MRQITGVGNLFVPWATSRPSKVSADQNKSLRLDIRHFTADLMAMTKEKKGLRLKIRHFAPDSMAVTKENSTSAGLQMNFNHMKKIAGRMKLLGGLVWPAGRRLPTLAL